MHWRTYIMPLTLPAHAAAALPFARLTPRWLNAHALVVGCCAPDLVYLFGGDKELSHSFGAGLLVSTAVGVCAFAWCEWLAFPAARALMPVAGWLDVRRMLAPRVPSHAAGWLPVIAALIVGALTHIVWDGFTHPGWWPGTAVYGAAVSESVPKRAWVLSTIVGTALVLWFSYQRYRTARFLELRPGAWTVIAVTCAAACGGFIAGRLYLAPDTVVPDWPAQMLAIRCGFACLTVACWFFGRRARQGL